MDKPSNILIVRTDRIGDLILTLPAARIIKKHYPECRVTFLVRDYTRELALNNPYIDEVITLTETGGKFDFFANYNIIRKKNFDAAVTVYPRFSLALLLFMAGIKKRAGTGYRWYSFLFNKKIYEHRRYGDKHELVHNINLLKSIGIEETVTEKDVVYGLSPSEENRIKAAEALAEMGIAPDRPMVIFHPGSRGSSVDLPAAKMKELIKKTSEETGANVLLTGNNEEKEFCAGFALNENIYNACGRFNLGELTAVIEKARLLIANSTGPLHIAAALGINVIGFFPKIQGLSPARWAPFTEKRNIFVPPINCTGCSRKQCEELDCMNHIDTELVFETIRSIILKQEN